VHEKAYVIVSNGISAIFVAHDFRTEFLSSIRKKFLRALFLARIIFDLEIGMMSDTLKDGIEK